MQALADMGVHRLTTNQDDQGDYNASVIDLDLQGTFASIYKDLGTD